MLQVEYCVVGISILSSDFCTTVSSLVDFHNFPQRVASVARRGWKRSRRPLRNILVFLFLPQRLVDLVGHRVLPAVAASP